MGTDHERDALNADPPDGPTTGGGAIGQSVGRSAQELAKRFGPFHNLTYYVPEIRGFGDLGIKGWWNAYFAYRVAPLGALSTEAVVAVFYNFAPRMVARAIPGAWKIMSPVEVLARREEMLVCAFDRVFPEASRDPRVVEAASLARRAIEGAPLAGLPLFAGHASLPWPEDPLLALWHACTLMREHRGDCHNVALAAAGVDGVACHVLMAAQGYGNKASILPIRGWTDEEWEGAVADLRARGWLDRGGAFTQAGRDARRRIEQHTSELASHPGQLLGTDGVARWCALMDPLIAIAHERGDVPGQWPPPHLLRT